MGLATLRPVETAPDINLTDLEAALHESLERFDMLSKAWPKGRDALTRARIGREHDAALSEITALRDRIARIPTRSLADVAVKLRRLLVVVEGPEAETLLATALNGLESQADIQVSLCALSAPNLKLRHYRQGNCIPLAAESKYCFRELGAYLGKVGLNPRDGGAS